ncbi:N-acetylmuramoyl-L-alanine amidase [Chengkuizengella sp. SCS-71B]|uniref:N-acetylmuramoyl-L-alanine amidase n=1 Tax=Chengkuizengella sp. SCS-71B TaxID=3115290 RepID=UPI0032C23214
MPEVGFIVVHDTGNDGSTALQNITYYENSNNVMYASAHIFVDDTGIYECIPLLTDTPEKAWHVLYQKPLDNQIFGDDANVIISLIHSVKQIHKTHFLKWVNLMNNYYRM